MTVTLNPAIDHTVTIADFTAGEVNRVRDEVLTAGGKGINVAAALADFGCRVAATGFLGTDNDAIFDALIVGKHIHDGFIRRAGSTRIGIKIVDPVRQQTTDINFPGQMLSPQDLSLLTDQLMLLSAGRWVVLAGSLPPGVPSTLYRDLIARLKSRECRVLLDTSGTALSEAITAAPHIIKPNIYELETLAGHSLPTLSAIVDAARAILKRGVQMVAVSRGHEGACFVTGDAALTARSPALTVKSAVGAGDAMAAGIIAAQVQGFSLAQCARLATAFARDSLTRIGPGIDVSNLDAYMADVAIEEHHLT